MGDGGNYSAIENDPLNERQFRGTLLTFPRINTPTIPKTQTYRAFPWVYWDWDNIWCDKLVQLLESSPVHEAALLYKVGLTHGEGFYPLENDKALIDILNKTWKDEQGCDFDFNEVLFRTAFDYNMFGSFTMYCTYNLLGKLIYPQHLDHTMFRVSKLTEVARDRPAGYLSYDWARRYIYPNFYQKIYQFNPEFGLQDGLQVFYYKDYVPGYYYYTVPDYFAAIQWVELHRNLGIMDNNMVKKGFMGTTVITLFQGQGGQVSEQEKQEHQQGVEDNFKGVDNAGSTMLLWADDAERMPTVQVIDPHLTDKNRADLEKITVQNIGSGHGLTSLVLAGINTEGAQLGGSANEISVASEYFFNLKIRQRQFRLLRAFKTILRCMGYSDKIAIRNSKPLQFTFSESLLEKVLTVNELRKLIGYEPQADEALIKQPSAVAGVFKSLLANEIELDAAEARLGAFGWSKETVERIVTQLIYNTLTA